MLTTLACLAAIFVPLELLFPRRRQRLARPGLVTDLLFFSGQHVAFAALAVLVLSSAQHVVGGFVPALPVPGWAQVVLALVLGNLCVYWFHRACHHFDFLWRFHAVHHSSEHLDWVAAHREHPLDGLLTQLVLNLPAMVLGVSMKGLFAVALFRGLWAIFIHSNVKVPLGPLLYLFGSPRLHHWHHAKQPRAVANYGNLSPWTDLVFGTFHLPADDANFELGVPRELPRSWPGLILEPLRGAPASWALVAACVLTAFTSFAGDGGLDGGVDAGISSLFGGGGQNYLPATKSFGGGTLGTEGFGGLGLKGSGSGGDSLGIGGIGRRAEQNPTTPAEPVVMGSLSKDLIQKVVRSHSAMLKRCTTEHLATDGGVNSGKVVVKFVIDASGTVSQSQVTQTALANERLGSCLAAGVQQMTFPKPRGGGIVIVNYPFLFSAP